MKKKILVLSGAGISAESGLKTFRDSDGLWHGYDIYEVASPRGWAKDPKKEKEENFDVTIVTQNIDDLHERAGSSKVVHLHGEIFRMRSENIPDINYEIRGDIKLGDLAPDGGQLRPDIVWFEEAVPLIPYAAKLMTEADIFILVGTSLQVYPAAGLISYVADHVPKYIIDKKIPAFSGLSNVELFEMTATEGVEKLRHILKVFMK